MPGASAIPPSPLPDGADRTATPQKVLDALHCAAAMCRTRIPI